MTVALGFKVHKKNLLIVECFIPQKATVLYRIFEYHMFLLKKLIAALIFRKIGGKGYRGLTKIPVLIILYLIFKE